MKAKDEIKANIEQVAFLIQEDRRTAEIKMLKVIYGDKGIHSNFGFNPNLEVDVDAFEKVHGIKLRFAIEDLRDNALKRPAFKRYLLQQIPEEKLGAKFKGFKKPPKTIRLPNALRSLLTEETLQQIQDYWDKHYSGKVYTFYKDKDEKGFSPTFMV